MTSPLDRAAVERALALAREQVAMLEAALAGDGGAADEPIGTKDAARIWRVTQNAALKRLRKIGGKGLDGRWSAPRRLVEPRAGMFQAR